MFTTRALDQNDWQIFKDIRLEAVRLHENNFLASYELEVQKSDDYWKNTLLQDNKRVFGLFDGDTLIGIGGVFTLRTDTAGKTALLAMGYIREQYRGRKLSRMLYESRIGWAKESGLFDVITVSHREGNEASRNANQAFGFEYKGTDTITFGDGKQYTDVKYEMRLK